MTGRQVVVWANGSAPEKIPDGRLHYLWNHCIEGDHQRSLLAHVERHGDRLRDRYLRWIEELADTDCRGRSLVDKLELRNGLSYWWMTRAAERSPWRSDSIATVLRLMALEEMLQEESPPTVLLIGANRPVTKAVRGLCLRVGVQFARGNPPRRSLSVQLKRLKPHPHTLQAIVLFGQLVCRRWRFRRLAEPTWPHGDHSVFFCSVFMNLDREEAEVGRHQSTYWEGIPGILDEWGWSHNWVHLYLGAHNAPDVDESINLVGRFNDDPSRSDTHTFLEAYLSIGVLVRVLRQWVRLLVQSIRVRPFTGRGARQGDSPWLRSVMAKDFVLSLRGFEALTNLWFVELFDRIAVEMPTQASGYYLCENIAWERALIHAWQRHGHGRLVGVAHATVRFWDLKYQQDWKAWERRLERGVPEPNHLAVNGPMAYRSLRGDEAPSGFLLRCEAARYGRLVHRPDLRWSPPTGRRRLLVFCELSSIGTSFALSLLAAAIAKADRQVDVAVKPHPGYLPNSTELTAVGGQLVDGQVEDLLTDCDLVLVCNGTSSALNVRVFGWPMVVALSPTQLNLSDLRGDSDVEFVSTSEELAAFLSLDHQPPSPRPAEQYFDLDPELAGWRRCLAET